MPDYAYTTRDVVKATLHLDLGDTGPDAVIDAFIATMSAEINARTGRVFTPTAATRRFDAPVGAVLVVPDLLSITSVSAFGIPLTTDDYTLLTYDTPEGRPADTQLLRLVYGVPVAWRYTIAIPWQPYNAISITGTWGYDTTVPAPIAQLTEEGVVDLWRRRTREYSAGARPDGSAAPLDAPFWTPERLARLAPYIAPREIVV